MYGYLDPIPLVSHLIRVGDESVRRVVVLAADDGIMQLPDILKARRSMNGLPGRRGAAFARAVVHDRYARMNSLHERGRAGHIHAVVRNDVEIHSADFIVGAHEFVLLVPG